MTTETNKTPLPPPRKIQTYPLPDDPNGGAVFLYGNPDASKIAIFCAGYADDHRIGQVFCSRLAEENDTLVGLTCLPGFDDRPDKKWETHKSQGYTFDEMAGAIRDAVKVLRAESTNEKATLTGIFHDWGVAPGMLWANRSLEDENADSPDDIVLFDVLTTTEKSHKEGLPKFEKPSFYSTFVTLYYRVVLASAFATRTYVSKFLSKAIFIFGIMPFAILPIGPTLALDAEVSKMHPKGLDRMIYMAYPYLSMFKGLISGSSNEAKALSQCHLPKDLKKTPVLYLYGTKKRVMFHGEDALFVLEREAKENRSKSNAIAVENAGHWLYIQQPDLCLDEVKKFMSSKL